MSDGTAARCLGRPNLHNLDLIETRRPNGGTPKQDQPPYSDTQLLISLIGVLIFPHEKTLGALGELMRGYKSLRNVLNVVYLQRDDVSIELGEAVLIDPTRLWMRRREPVLL